MISKNERYYAEMVLDVIDNVECPMLMYEDEKAIVRKALKAYIENNDTADTPRTDLVEDSDDLVKDLVKDTPQIDYKDGKEYLRGYKQGIEDEINKHHVGR